jgi:hypothetical protein
VSSSGWTSYSLPGLATLGVFRSYLKVVRQQRLILAARDATPGCDQLSCPGVCGIISKLEEVFFVQTLLEES